MGRDLAGFMNVKFFGFSGYALDYSWDRRIHTPLDNIENVNLSSLQHQGYRARSLASHFGNLDSLDDPKTPDLIYFNVLRLGVVRYARGWVVPIMALVVLVFSGTVFLGFRRRVVTPAGIGLGALVFAVSLISAPLFALALWAFFANVVPAYQVTFAGHAVNEARLLALFACTTLALTATWYAVMQKIRCVLAPCNRDRRFCSLHAGHELRICMDRALWFSRRGILVLHRKR